LPELSTRRTEDIHGDGEEALLFLMEKLNFAVEPAVHQHHAYAEPGNEYVQGRHWPI
jgi:hypothetical protein